MIDFKTDIRERPGAVARVMVVVVCVGAIMGEGLLVMIGWGWFVVPLGLRDIGYAQAIGLTVVCTLLTVHQKDSWNVKSPRTLMEVVRFAGSWCSTSITMFAIMLLCWLLGR